MGDNLMPNGLSGGCLGHFPRQRDRSSFHRVYLPVASWRFDASRCRAVGAVVLAAATGNCELIILIWRDIDSQIYIEAFRMPM